MFKRILEITLLVCLATGTAWGAENPFVGAWKLDPAKSRFPDEMKVRSAGGNKYVFDFTGSPETVVVDGSFQPGLGGTLLSVKAAAPDSWIVERKKDTPKKDAPLLLKGIWTLAKDGSTLTDNFRQLGPDGSTLLSMDYIYRRVGAGSGFAADWQSIKETTNASLVMQVKDFQPGGLTFISPSTAKSAKNLKFDGKDYPSVGPDAIPGASAAMQRVNAHALIITDRLGGKIMDTRQMEISADLKTLTSTVHISGRDTPNVMVFERM